jgi:uncharacterized protein (DUF305 family)
MIPHHDVAIEMSKRIIDNSKNPAIIEFANETIRTQKYEIWVMKQALHCRRKVYSTLLK